jgi:hypothetical protein
MAIWRRPIKRRFGFELLKGPHAHLKIIITDSAFPVRLLKARTWTGCGAFSTSVWNVIEFVFFL